MPLTSLQSDILRLLAAHRDPESYVAGGTPLNRDTARYSGDIDIFQDREERVAQAAEADARVLADNSYDVRFVRRERALYTVLVGRDGETTRLVLRSANK